MAPEDQEPTTSGDDDVVHDQIVHEDVVHVDFAFKRALAKKIEGNLASFCYQAAVPSWARLCLAS